MLHTTTSRIGATTLAALRFYQSLITTFPGRVSDYLSPEFLDIAANGGELDPLSPDEVDALCLSLNSGGAIYLPTADQPRTIADVLAEIARLRASYAAGQVDEEAENTPESEECDNAVALLDGLAAFIGTPAGPLDLPAEPEDEDALGLYEVQLVAEGVQVTGMRTITQAERAAVEDAREFRADWVYSSAEVEDAPDYSERFEDADEVRVEVELTSKHRGGIYNFAATFTAVVEASDEETAILAALDLIGAPRSNLKREG